MKRGETLDGTVFKQAVASDSITLIRTAADAVYYGGTLTSVQDGRTPTPTNVPLISNFRGVTNAWSAHGGSDFWLLGSAGTSTSQRRNLGSRPWLQTSPTTIYDGSTGIPKTFDSPIRLYSGNAVLLENGELWAFNTLTATANRDQWHMIVMSAVPGWNAATVREIAYCRQSITSHGNVLMWVDSNSPSIMRKTHWSDSVVLPIGAQSATEPLGRTIENFSPAFYGTGSVSTEAVFYYLADGAVWKSSSFPITSAPSMTALGELFGQSNDFVDYFLAEGPTNSLTQAFGMRIIGLKANGTIHGFGANRDGVLDPSSTANLSSFQPMVDYNRITQVVGGRGNIIAIRNP